jgi:hypothetical protein
VKSTSTTTETTSYEYDKKGRCTRRVKVTVHQYDDGKGLMQGVTTWNTGTSANTWTTARPNITGPQPSDENETGDDLEW